MDTFHHLIALLIVENKRNRALVSPDIRGLMSPEAFAFEFSTIKVDIGRRTGKTAFIKRNIKPTDLLFVPSRAFAVACYPDGPYCHTVKEFVDSIDPVERYKNIRNRGLKAEKKKLVPPPMTVYFDEIGLTLMHGKLNEDLYVLYRHITKDDPDATFIFLGA